MTKYILYRNQSPFLPTFGKQTLWKLGVTHNGWKSMILHLELGVCKPKWRQSKMPIFVELGFNTEMTCLAREKIRFNLKPLFRFRFYRRLQRFAWNCILLSSFHKIDSWISAILVTGFPWFGDFLNEIYD